MLKHSIYLVGNEEELETRCLAAQPKYIFLDEPFAGEPITVGEIRDLVRELKNRHIGIIITDHNVRELKIVDRSIINDGKIIKSGTPKFVIDQDVRGISR